MLSVSPSIVLFSLILKKHWWVPLTYIVREGHDFSCTVVMGVRVDLTTTQSHMDTGLDCSLHCLDQCLVHNRTQHRSHKCEPDYWVLARSSLTSSFPHLNPAYPRCIPPVSSSFLSLVHIILFIFLCNAVVCRVVIPIWCYRCR